MTPAQVLKNVQDNRVDQRTLCHAVRLGSLVEIINEEGKPVDTYQKALDAKGLAFRITRRGSEILAKSA
jgi:hypothetical protein